MQILRRKEYQVHCSTRVVASLLHLKAETVEERQQLVRNTASALHKYGHMRLADFKTSENMYGHFAEPTTLLGPGLEVEEQGGDTLRDFLEIHDVTLNFGSPETADMMSGRARGSAFTITESMKDICKTSFKTHFLHLILRYLSSKTFNGRLLYQQEAGICICTIVMGK